MLFLLKHIFSKNENHKKAYFENKIKREKNQMVVYIVGGLVVYLIASKYFGDFKPGDAKVNKDIAWMKSEISEFLPKLAPVDQTELETFSLDHKTKSAGGTFERAKKGIFFSIFQEDLLAFVHKEYLNGGKMSLTYVKTANHEFVFRSQKDDNMIYCDGNPVGILKGGKALVNTKQEVMARIDKSDPNEYAVIMGDKTVAKLNTPANAPKINPRAFQMMKDVNNDELVVLLAITIPDLVSFAINNK